MSNTYNIYKVLSEKKDQLVKKLTDVGLKEQKTIVSGNYSMVFYFSENISGNEVWWWNTYSDFFNKGVKEPKNYFNYGVLLCSNVKDIKILYAVSLGKSHFYLSKFISPDFGIHLAVRMANEDTILLKKSRYFAGSKRQEVSSFQSFNLGSYEAGESVDHLKLKAGDEDIWGKRNIIFADSIQMDINKNPSELSDIFDQITASFGSDEIIRLPKLEIVDEELSHELDSYLFRALKEEDNEVGVQIDEFYVSGIAICFRFHDYQYKVFSKKPNGKGNYKKNINSELEIKDIRSFLREYDDIADVNSIRVQFKMEGSGVFTKGVKEIIDIPIDYQGGKYFLRGGEWYSFNQVFMDYLKESLESIELEKSEDLNEDEYILWKERKEADIEAGEEVDNRLTYREYYFNSKMCKESGYELLDRVLTELDSLRDDRSKYKVEVADIYKDGEIISVKIAKDNQGLIYNIEQSKTAIELIVRGEIDFDHKLNTAALWFVFESDIEYITQVNSIQFLLAVESWKKMLEALRVKPKIYISRHIK